MERSVEKHFATRCLKSCYVIIFFYHIFLVCTYIPCACVQFVLIVAWLEALLGVGECAADAVWIDDVCPSSFTIATFVCVLRRLCGLDCGRRFLFLLENEIIHVKHYTDIEYKIRSRPT